MATALLEGDFTALPQRGLTEDACRKFGVSVVKMGGKPCIAMDYKDAAGVTIAQKVRVKREDGGKDFKFLGEAKNAGLFGQHLWAPGGKKIVVTEGELDAVALCQAQDLRWPVVSLQNGASAAKKSIAAAREFLESFEQVVLCFDADDAGREAVTAAAMVLSPGKCRVADLASIGVKDANEAILTDNHRGLIKAIWEARVYRPDGIVSLDDISSRVLAPLETGLSWPWQSMTTATFGRRTGELIGIGGGTSCGKSDFLAQCVAHDVSLGLNVGVLSLEQDVGDSGRRIAGKTVGKRLHVPDGSWTQEELEGAWNNLKSTNQVFLFDSFGAIDWSTIKSRINYLVDVCGCKVVYLDHLTALAAGEDEERRSLEKIMAEMSAMAKGRFIFVYVSHLATPSGDSHEEGGRVSAKHFKGSRAIAHWSHGMWGIERNTQAEDPEERCVTTLRCLKDRNTGQATGLTIRLRYNRETGLLAEDKGPGEQTHDTGELEAAF